MQLAIRTEMLVWVMCQRRESPESHWYIDTGMLYFTFELPIPNWEQFFICFENP